jgi:shikimate dehydrogenase
MLINNKTHLNMVIGFPLAQTQSPLLHNTIYQARHLNAILLAFPYPDIEPLTQSIKTLTVELTAVTTPFKEVILKYLDYCSPEVNALKAANTVIQREGKLWGYNTDIDGIAYALRNITTTNKNALIIGAGGVARAVAYFLQKNNAHLFWLNRTKMKAINLAKIFGGSILDSGQINDLSFDIIINTTSLGMFPHLDISSLPNYDFKPNQIVFDLVYNPINTTLLSQAHKNGAKIISGLEMFIGQGLRQIELWTGDNTIQTEKTMIEIRELLINEQKIFTH